MERRFLGWDTVVGGAILNLLHTALFFSSFGVYVVAWGDELGWSTTSTSTGFAIVVVVSGILATILGGILDRVGVRRVVAAGLTVSTLALLLISYVHTLPQFYAALTILGLGMAMSGFLPATSAIVPWFASRRSTAVALMSLGVSIGGLLVPVVATMVVNFGWRATLRIEALILFLLIVPVAILMRRPPESYGQFPDGRTQNGEFRTPIKQISLTLKEALRTRSFWLLAIGHASALVLVTAVNVHLVPHLVRGGSFDLASAARIVTLMTMAAGIGQLAGGPIGDRFDKRVTAGLAMWMHGGAIALLAWRTDPWTVVLFALLHGFAWGVRGPLMTSLRADYFGPRYFASIAGASMAILTLGQLGGPVVAGWLADLFGTYRLAFLLLAFVGVAASFSFWFAVPPLQQRGAR